MEYSNETLQKMEQKRLYNKQYSKWLIRLGKEYGLILDEKLDDVTGELICVPRSENLEGLRFHRRSEYINHCLDAWVWNVYHHAKIMDLVKVNRCKNTRFCPNCKALEAAKYIHKIKPIYQEYLDRGYHFYFLTLTVPSIIDGAELKDYIDRLYTSFSQFKNLYSFPVNSKKAFRERSVEFAGGIRVLEITHNKSAGYHPHLHCIVITEEPIPDFLLAPTYRGKFSRKRGSVDYKSRLECEIAKVWTLINADMWSQYNFDHYQYDPAAVVPVIDGVEIDYKNLEVDFRELDESGFKETFKYTVKSSEIKTYKIFKAYWFALYRRRIRQGFGLLYNLHIDDCIDDEGEEQPLPEQCAGLDPEQLITREMRELYTTYRDYKKISRFTPDDDSYYNIKD